MGEVMNADRHSTENPGAYLIQGHLFFRMPDRSTILCKCIGEPFSRMIVEMWNAQQSISCTLQPNGTWTLSKDDPPNWRPRCCTGEELS